MSGTAPELPPEVPEVPPEVPLVPLVPELEPAAAQSVLMLASSSPFLQELSSFDATAWSHVAFRFGRVHAGQSFASSEQLDALLAVLEEQASTSPASPALMMTMYMVFMISPRRKRRGANTALDL